MSKDKLSGLRRAFSNAQFYLSYPFVIARFRLLERRDHRRRNPTKWHSSGELIAEDLAHYEGEGADAFFTYEKLKELANSRDKQAERIQANNRLNFTILVFLIAQYVSIEMNISVFGVSIKKAPGVTEALLTFLILNELFVSVQARNQYIIESTIKFLINKTVDPEIKNITLAQYIPNEQFGPYVPYNLPFLIGTKLFNNLTIYSSVLFLGLVIFPAIFFFIASHIALIQNLWSAPQFGWWSKALCIYLYTVLALSWVYAALVRIRMPRTDWSFNSFMALTKQLHPHQYDQHLEAEFGPVNSERRRLSALGYSVGIQDPDDVKRRRSRYVHYLVLFALLTSLLLLRS